MAGCLREADVLVLRSSVLDTLSADTEGSVLVIANRQFPSFIAKLINCVFNGPIWPSTYRGGWDLAKVPPAHQVSTPRECQIGLGF